MLTNQSPSNGVSHGGSSPRHIEFDKNVAQMTIDCARTDHEYICHFTVGVPFRYQPQYLQFSFGEVEIEFVARVCNVLIRNLMLCSCVISLLQLAHTFLDRV